MNEWTSELSTLAHLYGVQTSYYDAWGERRSASPEALLAVLRALEAPVESAGDVAEALRARREELAGRLAEPVAVAWDEAPVTVDLRWPARQGESLGCHLDREDGGRQAWVFERGLLPQTGPEQYRLTLPVRLPFGYHRLRLAAGGRTSEVRVIAAPGRAFSGDGGSRWGVFLPLYALRSQSDWGAGDLTDFARLRAWAAGLGGTVAATLPLLDSYLEEPCDPSPYSPVSRLFWNELYLDPRRLPELEESAAARRLIESADFTREVAALRAAPRVEYQRLMGLKRRVFEELAHRFFTRPSQRREEFEEYLASRPDLDTWAAFRAVGDRRGEVWHQWPERLREGELAPADYDEEDRRYHLWAQWAVDEQLRQLAGEARQAGPGLYLDLPLGVHGAAYDVWRERQLFARGVSAGAPPDALFTQGQDWGFPPLVPERLRAQGYRYWIDSLRHHLQHAGMLRIDHVMQLHRLYWVPQGFAATEGVYVTNPADELYAVLCLESQRHRARIVGENLGTVPPEVGESLGRHGLLGMYVVQYEIHPDGGLREPPANAVASLNTHDMPTFRGFWEGRDLAALHRLGLLDDESFAAQRERRRAQREGLARRFGLDDPDGAESVDGALAALLAELGASRAELVLVNLEDLWQEREPQNVPGTYLEHANWQRKARLTLEEMCASPEIAALLERLDERRRGRVGDD